MFLPVLSDKRIASFVGSLSRSAKSHGKPSTPKGEGDRKTKALLCVQFDATPAFRAVFEKPFEVGPDWTVYQLKGVAGQHYAPRQLNAALHLDSAMPTHPPS